MKGRSFEAGTHDRVLGALQHADDRLDNVRVGRDGGTRAANAREIVQRVHGVRARVRPFVILQQLHEGRDDAGGDGLRCEEGGARGQL